MTLMVVVLDNDHQRNHFLQKCRRRHHHPMKTFLVLLT